MINIRAAHPRHDAEPPALNRTGHYTVESYNRVMKAAPEPTTVLIPHSEVEGQIPESLRGGTYYLNGPGLIEIGGRTMHPFDGHGFVRACEFTNEGMVFKSNYVNTSCYQRESRLGRIDYHGIGTRGTGFIDDLRMRRRKNPSNTCVRLWGETLLSLYEGGAPHALNPESLETLRTECFHGAIDEKKPFLAHTQIDEARSRLVSLALTPGKETAFRFMEFDEDFRLVNERQVVVPGLQLIHEFLITPDYYVFLENSCIPKMKRFVKAIVGLDVILKALRMSPAHSKVWLVPRFGGEARVLPLDRPLFTFHYGPVSQSCDAEGEPRTLTLHTCSFPYFEFGTEFGYLGDRAPLNPQILEGQIPQVLHRIDIDLAKGTTTTAVVSERMVDFPIANQPQKGDACRYIYCATVAPEGVTIPFNSLVKFDLMEDDATYWTAPVGQFVGEPFFVPESNAKEEDDGWLLVVTYDGENEGSNLLVFSADALSEGPVATVRLPYLTPYGFHGTWRPPTS